MNLYKVFHFLDFSFEPSHTYAGQRNFARGELVERVINLSSQSEFESQMLNFENFTWRP